MTYLLVVNCEPWRLSRPAEREMCGQRKDVSLCGWSQDTCRFAMQFHFVMVGEWQVCWLGRIVAHRLFLRILQISRRQVSGCNPWRKACATGNAMTAPTTSTGTL